MCEIEPRKVIAVWGAGPVGQFAIASARMLGAERVIAIDRVPYRLRLALDRAGATDVINFDASIDAVGMEADGHGIQYAYDRNGQCHVHRYMRPLLERIERGDIDPTFVVSHHMPLKIVLRA